MSETRKYFTAQRYSPDVICSDLLFHVADEDGLQFALASSSMFITWQKTVGGRLKSDIRFANTLTWNTFPVPQLSDADRKAIITGGEAILKARALHPERSLADHYQPFAMAPELVSAHRKLDKAVDKAFGAGQMIVSEKDRLEVLFAHFNKLVKS